MSRPYVIDPRLAEAMAVYQGILLGKDLGGTQVIFEGDALAFVNDLRKDGLCRGEYGMVVNNAKACLM